MAISGGVLLPILARPPAQARISPATDQNPPAAGAASLFFEPLTDKERW
jgi:hypothetical protein